MATKDKPKDDKPEPVSAEEQDRLDRRTIGGAGDPVHE